MSLDIVRQRMIEETELALYVGLRFPNQVPRIPTIEAGRGAFDPDFVRRFWREALGLDSRRGQRPWTRLWRFRVAHRVD